MHTGENTWEPARSVLQSKVATGDYNERSKGESDEFSLDANLSSFYTFDSIGDRDSHRIKLHIVSRKGSGFSGHLLDSVNR